MCQTPAEAGTFPPGRVAAAARRRRRPGKGLGRALPIGPRVRRRRRAAMAGQGGPGSPGRAAGGRKMSLQRYGRGDGAASLRPRLPSRPRPGPARGAPPGGSEAGGGRLRPAAASPHREAAARGRACPAGSEPFGAALPRASSLLPLCPAREERRCRPGCPTGCGAAGLAGRGCGGAVEAPCGLCPLALDAAEGI